MIFTRIFSDAERRGIIGITKLPSWQQVVVLGLVLGLNTVVAVLDVVLILTGHDGDPGLAALLGALTAGSIVVLGVNSARGT